MLSHQRPAPPLGAVQTSFPALPQPSLCPPAGRQPRQVVLTLIDFALFQSFPVSRCGVSSSFPGVLCFILWGTNLPAQWTSPGERVKDTHSQAVFLIYQTSSEVRQAGQAHLCQEAALISPLHPGREHSSPALPGPGLLSPASSIRTFLQGSLCVRGLTCSLNS